MSEEKRIKIVIDIDEERYKQIVDEQWLPNRLTIEKAIANGIPFPIISDDGTLTVNVEDGNKVSRVLVCGENHFGGLYYPEQEPCDDCISRKAALDKIKEICFSKEQEWIDFRVSQGSNGQRDFIINFIESMPSVQLKQSIIINGDMSANNTTEQIIWERDTAIQQLKDLGYGLGEKPKRDKGDKE